MINRAIRTLPFPLVSTYTREIVAKIKSIPDENIEYTESEIAWMNRAIQNLEYMFAHAKRCKLADSIEAISISRSQIETALTGCNKQRE